MLFLLEASLMLFHLYLQLAYALRRGPYQTNLLVGGVDKETGPALYWMDYLASMTETKYGSHGYASFFCQSIFDRYWKVRASVDLWFGIGRQAVKTEKYSR